MSTFLKMLGLPGYVLYTLLTTSYASYNSDKSFRRIIWDSVVRYSYKGDMTQVSGTTLEVYKRWAKTTGNEETVDEIGADAQLLWLGPKTVRGHVLLVFHGGGYMMPIPDFALSCWRYVGQQVAEAGVEIGVAVLHYSLAPAAKFPTQLIQASHALSALLAAGVPPSRIHLAGDSAGGNLVLQLLSHILHPHPAVPALSLPHPLAAAFLFSPWTTWCRGTPSWSENAALDYVPVHMIPTDSAPVLEQFGIQEEYRAFAEPGTLALDGSDAWFAGLPGTLRRVVVAAGGCECMRDDIVRLAEVLQAQAKYLDSEGGVQLVVQHGGLHVDMIMDFFAGDGRRGRVGSLTKMLIERLVADGKESE
ncbi:Abhydrolase-3 domain-containing protein [Mycena kentingensis (nom. inval.)]|nr:Abhydrolase-3 domain-containing protein [Mycena kentingensis (nom. inval.)]